MNVYLWDNLHFWMTRDWEQEICMRSNLISIQSELFLMTKVPMKDIDDGWKCHVPLLILKQRSRCDMTMVSFKSYYHRDFVSQLFICFRSNLILIIEKKCERIVYKDELNWMEYFIREKFSSRFSKRYLFFSYFDWFVLLKFSQSILPILSFII